METEVKYFGAPLCFYYKGSIRCEQGILYVEDPKSFIGLLPGGKRKYTIPVAQITMIDSKVNYKPTEFFGGLIWLIIGILFQMNNSGFITFIVLSFIFFIPAIASILEAPEVIMQIRFAGSGQIARFSIFNKRKQKEAQDMITQYIANNLYNSPMNGN